MTCHSGNLNRGEDLSANILPEAANESENEGTKINRATVSQVSR
jgi:hypothetical protein